MNPSQNTQRYVTHRGIQVPTFIYGTAWKEEQSEALTRLALDTGFRGIDTANQRRHYNEEGVGAAIQNVLAAGHLKREDLFLQSKFTYAAAQDHRLPFDPEAAYADQVAQSLESSLAHLHTEYLDAYLLHGPLQPHGFCKADWQVWRAMERLQNEGKIRLLGISNIYTEQLDQLLEGAEVKPAFVQNRCFARTSWDAEIRARCASHDIIYQGFSLLTANAEELESLTLQQVARRLPCTPARVIFRFAQQMGMIPLTGTTDPAHMQEDLAAYKIELSKAELAMIENIAAPFQLR
jgi:diketogulonate reductase-like aldo/keto reductase